MRIRDLFRRKGTLVVYRGGDGKWYWRHVSRNGKTDNASEQGYATRRYARRKALDNYPDLVVEQEAV